MEEKTIVSIHNLVKRYGDVLALDHLDLEIKRGEIYGLLGPNGSGKTTAINCLLALLGYDKGSIRVFGENMEPDSYESKRRIGVVMQNVAVFEELTVRENIDYFCSLYVKDKKRRRQLVEEAVRFTGLEDHLKKYPKKLSGGLLRRLNIACGIAHRPELILMDEPTVAVDPQSRNHIHILKLLHPLHLQFLRFFPRRFLFCLFRLCGFELRPDGGLFLLGLSGLMGLGLLGLGLGSIGKIGKGNLFPGFYLGLQLAHGWGVIDNAVNHVFVLLCGQLGGTQGIFP